jgi:hypothetical protein
MHEFPKRYELLVNKINFAPYLFIDWITGETFKPFPKIEDYRRRDTLSLRAVTWLQTDKHII